MQCETIFKYFYITSFSLLNYSITLSYTFTCNTLILLMLLYNFICTIYLINEFLTRTSLDSEKCTKTAKWPHLKENKIRSTIQCANSGILKMKKIQKSSKYVSCDDIIVQTVIPITVNDKTLKYVRNILLTQKYIYTLIIIIIIIIGNKICKYEVIINNDVYSIFLVVHIVVGSSDKSRYTRPFSGMPIH